MEKEDISRLKVPCKNRNLELIDNGDGSVMINGDKFWEMDTCEIYLESTPRVDLAETPKLKCNECGSSELEWDHGAKITSGVVQGRLNTNDVETFFYLGCNECSETVKIVSCDDVANLLNNT